MTLSLKEYGNEFLLKLFKTLIEDHKFFLQISTIIDPEYLIEERFKVIYKIIISHFEKYHGIPTYSTLESYINLFNSPAIKESLNELLIQIQNCDRSDIAWVKETTVKFCRHQLIKRSMLIAAKKLKDQDYDAVEEIMMDALRKMDVEHNLDHDYWDDFDLRIENARVGVIPTGWTDFDKRLNGGLGIGELGVIVAPTGFGKTYSLTSLACGAMDFGFDVLFYSFELSDYNIGLRADAYFSGIEVDNIINQKDRVREILKKKKDGRGKLIIRRFPTKSMNVSKLIAYTNRMEVVGFRPQLIVIDYADLIKPSSTDEKRLELEAIYEQLRGWGGESGYPIWTASQTNRGGLDKDYISIGDLAESFNKAMVADVLVGQTRSPEQKMNNEATFFLAKSRVGKDGYFYDAVFNTSLTQIRLKELSIKEANEILGKSNRPKLSKSQKEDLKM